MKLSYIVYQEDIEQIHKEQTSNGTYYFIRKNKERNVFAYRRITTKTGYYFVQVSLPQYLMKELVFSGKINKIFS